MDVVAAVIAQVAVAMQVRQALLDAPSSRFRGAEAMHGPLACRPMQPQVTFRSDSFNTSQPREHFINPDCFGDDVATWLIQELRARGVQVDAEPGQEDFGWFVRYQVFGTSYCFVLALIPGDGAEETCWAGWFERDAGVLATLLGGRRRGIAVAAMDVVREVLASSPHIRDVEWNAGVT